MTRYLFACLALLLALPALAGPPAEWPGPTTPYKPSRPHQTTVQVPVSTKAEAQSVSIVSQAPSVTVTQAPTASSGGSTSIGGGATLTIAEAVQHRAPVASAVAPTIHPTAPCMVAYGVGAQTAVIGLSFGGAEQDRDCTRREYARLLDSLGERDAALGLLCLSEEVRVVMRGRCPR